MFAEQENRMSPERGLAEIEKFLPSERADYYAALHDKHFNPEKSVGSLITEARNLRDLLARAIEQRGSLQGDDREKFIALGVAPESLLPDCRYLKVQTGGEVGIVKGIDLSPDTAVSVLRTKPGVPCSLVVERVDFPPVDFGTIIIGPNEKAKTDDPEPSTAEMIWTVHPGLPIRPALADYWPAGSVIAVRDVIARLGENAYLNVRKPK